MKPQILLRILSAAAIAAMVSLSGLAAESARPFTHPDRIRYDRHCLTIDGKDVLIYSGSFHYFRCPKALWRDRFQKIKDAGFNAVETYAAWNWHEPQMPRGLNDFSKVNLSDLDDWLTMAEQFGFYVIVRPGPYICAEWDTGGFPQWLLTRKPAGYQGETWLRSDDPVFLAWCKHWYDAVCPVIAKHQITRKAPGSPGVILVQLENEYDYAHFPDDVKIHQVKALAEDARADGIDVPFITCWTHQVRGSTDPVLRQVFDSCNFYPRWGVGGELGREIPKLRREQPDAPLMTTELQGGWFSQVGGKLSQDQDGLDAAQIQNLTLFALQEGDTLMNYYMLFGGSNFGDRGARNITTTYDYNAPIREWGGVDARYQRVWALGHMLREHGARLARAVAVKCDVTTSQPDVTVAMRQALDGSRYLFVRTSQHAEPRQGTAHVRFKAGEQTREVTFDYTLEPFGAKILYLPPGVTDAAQGQWLPKPAPAIDRPTELPASITLSTARCQNDPGPSRWKKMRPGEDLARLGVYDSRFIFYRLKVNAGTETNLLVEYPAADTVLASLNGKPEPRSGGTTSSSVFKLPRGRNALLLLYENLGHANGGAAMEAPCGIFSAQLTSSSDNGKPLDLWRMQEVNGTSRRPEVKPDYDDTGWTRVSADKLEADNLPAGHTAVYRIHIALTRADLAGGRINLKFGRIDDRGWIYVNGNRVGEATDWARKYAFDVTRELRPGTNVIAVVVHNNDGAGGIGLASLAPQPEGNAVPIPAFGDPAGLDAHWYAPRYNDRRWRTVKIGDTAAPNNGLLSWYRMHFRIEPAKPGVWVPWRLHLEAAGNGFLYLNGHPLGRYWQAGPQHDFFLPECWLNFGGNNVVALSLRPIDNAAGIESARIEPYSDFAEKR